MTAPRSVTVLAETVTVRKAHFSVPELARLTGETEQDIQDNIDHGTFSAWVQEYLAAAPMLLAAMDAAPGLVSTTSGPAVSAILRLPLNRELPTP